MKEKNRLDNFTQRIEFVGKYIPPWIKYMFNSWDTRITIFVLIVTSFIFVLDVTDNATIVKIREDVWDKIIQHYVALGTFLVAFSAWFLTVQRNWKESLPKRLSVYFIYNNKIVMQASYAYLSGESDIRQMGQQIGAQIADDRFLSFSVANVIWKEVALVDTKDNAPNCLEELDEFPFRHYAVLYELSALPEKLERDSCYLWEPPFNPRSDSKLQYSDKVTLPDNINFSRHKFWGTVQTKGYCNNKSFLMEARQA